MAGELSRGFLAGTAAYNAATQRSRLQEQVRQQNIENALRSAAEVEKQIGAIVEQGQKNMLIAQQNGDTAKAEKIKTSTMQMVQPLMRSNAAVYDKINQITPGAAMNADTYSKGLHEQITGMDPLSALQAESAAKKSMSQAGESGRQEAAKEAGTIDRIIGVDKSGAPVGQMSDGTLKAFPEFQGIEALSGKGGGINVYAGGLQPGQSYTPEYSKEPGIGSEMQRNAELASGPVAGVSKLFSNTVGAIVPGVSERLDAEQKIMEWNQQIKNAFTRNPRFPVTELKTIERDLLIDPKAWFTDPEAEGQKVWNLRDSLIRFNEADAKSLGMPGSKKSYEDTLDIMKTRQTVIDMIGPKPAGISNRSVELANKVKDGTATDAEIEEYLKMKGQ